MKGPRHDDFQSSEVGTESIHSIGGSGFLKGEEDIMSGRETSLA